VIEASKLLHMQPNVVKQLMKIDRLPIGFVNVNTVRGREYYRYHIYLELILDLLPDGLNKKEEAEKELEKIRAEIKAKEKKDNREKTEVA